MDSENGKGKGKAKAKEKVKKGGKKAASSSASSSEESGETSSGGETFLFIQDKLVHKFFRQSQFLLSAIFLKTGYIVTRSACKESSVR